MTMKKSAVALPGSSRAIETARPYADEAGHEVNWVHWQVDADGPEAADAVTAVVEPDLRRVSDWRHGVSASGMDYWTADAEWATGSAGSPRSGDAGSMAATSK